MINAALFRTACLKISRQSMVQEFNPPTTAISSAMGSRMVFSDNTSTISRSAISNNGRTISAAWAGSVNRCIPYRVRPSFTICRRTIPTFFLGMGRLIISSIISFFDFWFISPPHVKTGNIQTSARHSRSVKYGCGLLIRVSIQHSFLSCCLEHGIRLIYHGIPLNRPCKQAFSIISTFPQRLCMCCEIRYRINKPVSIPSHTL